MGMLSQDDDSTGVALGVVFGVIALVIGLVIGLGIYKTRSASAPAQAVAAAADGASVVVENGVVKFYFASGKAELAAGAKEALGGVVKGVQAGQRAVVSGFHDTTGDPAKNEELAKQRALAVRDALVAEGIAEGQIELKKPENATGSGPAALARRVEVALQ